MTEEIIEILIQVKNQIVDTSNVVSAGYESPEIMRKDIERIISELQQGKMHGINEAALLFAPTGPFQEHSISNHWSEEYIRLAGRFDKLIELGKTND